MNVTGESELKLHGTSRGSSVVFCVVWWEFYRDVCLWLCGDRSDGLVSSVICWQMLAQPGESFHLSLERKELSQSRDVKNKKKKERFQQSFCATHTKQNVDELVQLDFFFFFLQLYLLRHWAKQKKKCGSKCCKWIPSDHWHNLNEMLECCGKNLKVIVHTQLTCIYY